MTTQYERFSRLLSEIGAKHKDGELSATEDLDVLEKHMLKGLGLFETEEKIASILNHSEEKTAAQIQREKERQEKRKESLASQQIVNELARKYGVADVFSCDPNKAAKQLAEMAVDALLSTNKY